MDERSVEKIQPPSANIKDYPQLSYTNLPNRGMEGRELYNRGAAPQQDAHSLAPALGSSGATISYATRPLSQDQLLAQGISSTAGGPSTVPVPVFRVSNVPNPQFPALNADASFTPHNTIELQCLLLGGPRLGSNSQDEALQPFTSLASSRNGQIRGLPFRDNLGVPVNNKLACNQNNPFFDSQFYPAVKAVGFSQASPGLGADHTFTRRLMEPPAVPHQQGVANMISSTVLLLNIDRNIHGRDIAPQENAWHSEGNGIGWHPNQAFDNSLQMTNNHTTFASTAQQPVELMGDRISLPAAYPTPCNTRMNEHSIQGNFLTHQTGVRAEDGAGAVFPTRPIVSAVAPSVELYSSVPIVNAKATTAVPSRNVGTQTASLEFLYLCPNIRCNQSFHSIKALEDHADKHARPHVCKQKGCRERFAQIADLQRHKLSGHLTFYCPELGCNRAEFGRGGPFDRKENLTRHIGDVHRQKRVKRERDDDETAFTYGNIKTDTPHEEEDEEETSEVDGSARKRLHMG